MKNSVLLLLSIALLSCGGSGDDDEPTAVTPSTPTVENKEPSIPSLINPADGLLCTDNPLDFSWSIATDPDGDAITYEIQVATNNTFSNDLQTKTNSGTTADFTLLKGVAYYWRVRAKDSKNNTSAYSTIRKYYTEGEGVSNHLPYAATLVEPALSATLSETTATLKWTASDVDDDPITYDVYFGKENPPTLVKENVSEMEYAVDLEAETTYFWKIVVKDNQGGEAIGQVWSFKNN